MEYAKFLASVAPAMMGMNSSTCLLDRDLYWDAPNTARRAVSSKYTLTDIGPDYFDIHATFSVALEWSNSDGVSIQPFKIECVFFGHFHADAPIDRDNAKKFAATESWLLFWPFFRQFIADTTARMAIPPVIVPLALRAGSYQSAVPKRAARLTARKKPNRRR